MSDVRRDSSMAEQDDWLRQLGAELSDVEASPAFAARVRAAVAEEHRVGAFSWSRWMWRAGLVAGAAAVVVAISFTRHGSTPKPAMRTLPQSAAVVPIPVPLPPTVDPSPVVAVPRRAVRIGTAPATVATLDLRVVTDQPDVLNRLWRDVPAQAIDPVEADRRFREALVASGAPPAAVSELVVELISVKPLDAPDAVGARAGGIRLVGDETPRSR